MKVKAVSDKIIVQVRTNETVTKSGIIIPDVNKKERYYEGVVVDAADHPSIKETGVKVGDYVFYAKGYNSEFRDEKDVLYDIVSIFDVLAVKEN